MPSVDGTNGQALVTDGSGTLSWAAAAGSPGGSDTQLQYNSSGSFAGASGLVTDGSNLTINAQGDLRFADSDSSNWVAFQAPATIASDVTWTLPNADGTSGQVLSTDGSGTLSWATASGGGGGGGTSVTVTQITATAAQTDFSVTYTVGQLSVYLNGALLASADFTATNGTTVVLAAGAAAGDIFTALAYDSATQITQGDTKVEVTDTGSDGTITFDTDGSERMRIDSSGNVIVGDTSTTAKFAVKNDTNDGTYSIKIYGVVGPSTTYLDSEGGKTWGTGSGEFQIQNGTSTRPAILSLGGTLDAGEGLGVINFFRSSNTNDYRARAQIAGQVTATGTADQYGGLLAFRTAADGASNTSERMRIAPTGELLVGKTTVTANGGVLQVSNGISFPATQSASSDANTLDDYEEGTFTPTISGSTTAGAGTYIVQVGRYTKIGNCVSVDINIGWSAHTGTGNMRITNLPFTSSATPTNNTSCASFGAADVALTANNILTGLVEINKSYITLFQYPTGGGTAVAVPMDSAASISVSVLYSV
jgi:predicted secreted protein